LLKQPANPCVEEKKVNEQIMRPVAVFVVSIVLVALAAGAALAVSAKNPVLSVIRNPAAIITWTFTTNYTAVFASGELNTQFNDCILLFEDDLTSADDLLPSKGCADPEEFIASRTEVPRTKQVTLTDQVLDTELGYEEVYAVVQLSSQTTTAEDSTRTTVVKVPT
jgi:hypothetical protein